MATITYDLNYPASIVLQTVTDSVVLANTVRVVKDETNARGGNIGQGIDVYINPLSKVQVRTYTKADKDANRNYTFDTISLTPINIRLADELYGAVQVDGWDNLSFNKDNYQDFATEITYIANQIATKLELAVGEVLNDREATETVAIPSTAVTRADKGEEIIDVFNQMKLKFDSDGVDSTNRYAAVGETAYRWLLATDAIRSAAQTGDDVSVALRNAIVGQVANFVVVPSSEIDANSVVFYQKEAVGILSRASGKNTAAPYSELISVKDAPINVRASIIGMGARNATGLFVGTFFTVADLVEAGQENLRIAKVDFTDGSAARVASVEEAPVTTAKK